MINNKNYLWIKIIDRIFLPDDGLLLLWLNKTVVLVVVGINGFILLVVDVIVIGE